MPPIRRPDKVIEERRTLGSYERQLEQDRITVQGMQAGATAIAGIASGLGIFGAAGIAALLWGKDLEKLFQQMVGVWPESGVLFSPEWIAMWGDNPIDQTSDAQNQPDNDGVNSLDPVVQYDANGQVIVSRSMEGKSPYEVYTIAASGRQANYDYARNNIIATYRAAHPLTAYGPHDSDERIIAQWHSDNPAPPPFLLDNQIANQTNIRVTCARRNVASFLRYFQNVNPTRNTNFIKDPLLDWIAYNTIPIDKNGEPKQPHATVFNACPKRPYNYIKFANKGEQLIAAYAWWTAPVQSP